MSSHFAQFYPRRAGKTVRMLHYAPFSFLVLATTHATWVLQTNVEYITPSETKDVQLVCKQDGNVENDKGIQTINGIRIMKLDPVGNTNVFAEIHVLTNQPSSTDKNVQVTANLRKENVAFLKVTWPVANDETEGTYRCEISGYDASDNMAFLNARPGVQLKRKMLTESDVMDLIRRMTESHVKKQKELEEEIGALRRIVDENLQSTTRIIRDKDNEVTTKLSSLKSTMESTYSTKRELKDQVTELKNFTINRIFIDKNQNQRQLDNLSTLVQNTSSNFDKHFSETTKSLSTLKAQLASSVDSMREKDSEIVSQLSSTTSNLATQIRLIDEKHERLKRKLASDLTRKISDLEQKCPCTRPAPTTAKPKPTPPKSIVSNWPAGDYALVRPETGCPNLNALKTTGKSLFKTVPYDDGRYYGSQYAPIKLLTSHDSKTNQVKYCVKDTSIPLVSSSTWPKGTYCIVKTGYGSCPSDFYHGYLNFEIENLTTGKVVRYYRRDHCCRSDQNSTVPIQLPKDVPFYLFRHRGTCQTVQGMTVRSHLLQIDTGADAFVTTTRYLIGHQVDFSRLPLVSLALCYYQPK